MTLIQFIYLILAGVSAALGQFGITAAYSYAPARDISVYDYTQVVFSTLMSLIVFGTVPDALSVIGYIIIFGATVIMFIRYIAIQFRFLFEMNLIIMLPKA